VIERVDTAVGCYLDALADYYRGFTGNQLASGLDVRFLSNYHMATISRFDDQVTVQCHPVLQLYKTTLTGPVDLYAVTDKAVLSESQVIMIDGSLHRQITRRGMASQGYTPLVGRHKPSRQARCHAAEV
jgi:hypothetical protein